MNSTAEFSDYKFRFRKYEYRSSDSGKYRWGIKISRFSTNKSLYLVIDTRECYSYYGRRIGTDMRSIKWCHFQWSWTNPNPVFKVTPLFDAKYFKNGYRYGHSYYRRQIGNRTQSFEWYQLELPCGTSSPDFKVTILFNLTFGLILNSNFKLESGWVRYSSLRNFFNCKNSLWHPLSCCVV